jgi:hypothetical protein
MYSTNTNNASAFAFASAQAQEEGQEAVDHLLEKETQKNKTESWNKLNKTMKIQKLNHYAEKYATEHKYSERELGNLKTFFLESLERGKLQKTKEVVYDKDQQQIDEIPGLFYHQHNHNFTLRIIDTKRVSTLKSLTPKRIIDSRPKLTIQEEEGKL